MRRRSLLKLASGLLATACGAVVGIPGLRYLVGTVRQRQASEATVQRVMRLKDLPIGRPVQVAVTGRRRDAWTVYDRETIGRVWLIRRGASDSSDNRGSVAAFTAVCPHLGCMVKLEGAKQKQRFTCPCHKAAWNLAGGKVSDAELGHRNPSPRGLDALDCRLVADDEDGELWVEVKYQRFVRGSTTKVVDA